MKSMSGFRRMWSDYGFEGVFRTGNILKMIRYSVMTLSTGLTIFSSIALLSRERQNTSRLLQDALDSTILRPVHQEGKEDIWSRLLHELGKRGLSREDLSPAIAHVTPFHSDFSELVFIRDYVNADRSDSEGLRQIAISSNVSDAMRQLILSELPAANDPDKLVDRLIARLVQKWIDSGYLSMNSYPKRSEFSNRETSEAVGVDIGCTVGPRGFFDAADATFFPADQLTTAANFLEQWGFLMVKKTLHNQELQRLKGYLELSQEPASEVGERVVRMDPNIARSRATANRLHLLLRGSKLEHVFESVHASLAPVIARIHYSRFPGSRIMISDLRLVIVDHAAEKGNWSLYNPRGGYTVMIPLHNRDSRDGTHSFLVGSHFLSDERQGYFRRALAALQRIWLFPKPINVSDLQPDGCWRAGDALVVENRLLIRSESNKLFKSGTYLVLKYETCKAAPNQAFWGGKLLFRVAALIDTIAEWSDPKFDY